MTAASDNTDRKMRDLKRTLEDTMSGERPEVNPVAKIGKNGPAQGETKELYTSIKVCVACKRCVEDHRIVCSRVCPYCGNSGEYSHELMTTVVCRVTDKPSFGDFYNPDDYADTPDKLLADAINSVVPGAIPSDFQGDGVTVDDALTQLEENLNPDPPVVTRERRDPKSIEKQDRRFDPYPKKERKPIRWGFWFTAIGTTLSFGTALWWAIDKFL